MRLMGVGKGGLTPLILNTPSPITSQGNQCSPMHTRIYQCWDTIESTWYKCRRFMIMNYSLQFHKVVLGKAILKGIHCSRGGGEGKLEYLQEILPQINIKFFTSFNFPGCQNSYFLAKLWFFKSYVHFLNRYVISNFLMQFFPGRICPITLYPIYSRKATRILFEILWQVPHASSWNTYR